MQHYKVWVQIERVSSGTENIDEPVDVFVGSLRQCREVLREIADRYVDDATKQDWLKRGVYPYDAKARHKRERSARKGRNEKTKNVSRRLEN